ncbi:MAG TPA: dephospho-CoA kinase [Anaerolineae bacterium]|nr:dephospho-CoA kinase [Anaerolineae bacterium]
MKYLIGLTGNIAAGKSVVAHMLADLGAEVIDADALVHALQRKGTPTYAAIVAEFGMGSLRDDGELDRRALGAIVFSDPMRLRALEAILYPAVLRESQRRIAEAQADVVVYEAIKLIEAGRHTSCDAVWVVIAPRAVQIARLRQQRGLSQAEAIQRIAAQPPQSEKLKYATLVIDNSGSLETTRAQVERAYAAIQLSL